MNNCCIFSTMTERYDYLFKYIIIGDAAAGKSSILHRFIENKCKSPTKADPALTARYFQTNKSPITLLVSSLAPRPCTWLARTSSCKLCVVVAADSLRTNHTGAVGHSGPGALQIRHAQLLSRCCRLLDRVRHHLARELQSRAELAS